MNGPARPQETPEDGAVALRRKGRGLLALAKTDRPAAEEAFAQLRPDEQRELVLAARVTSRIDLLFLAEDCTELAQSLPQTEFYRTVMAGGMWESRELVEAASVDQVRFILDAECWEGERFRSRKFLNWLRLFLDCDDREAERLLRGISADLLVYGLKRYVRFVGDLIVAGRYHCTPDQVRVANPTVREFVLRLFDIDDEYFVRLMAWVSTLSDDTAEADAVAAREGRLVEQGFPHLSQSQSVYEAVEPHEAPGLSIETPGFGLAEARAIMLSERARTLFFHRALDEGIRSGRFRDGYAGRLQHEVILLANKVMMADQIELTDEPAQRRVLDRVRRWVNIGIEAMAAGVEANGVEILVRQEFELAFRVANTMINRLRSEVADIEMRLPERLLKPLLGIRYGIAWAALNESEPALPPLAGAGEHGRSIGTLTELRAAISLAHEIAAVVDLHTGMLPLDVRRIVGRDGAETARQPPSAREISGMLVAQILEGRLPGDEFEVLPNGGWESRIRGAATVFGGSDGARARVASWIDRWHAGNGRTPFQVEVLRRLWGEILAESVAVAAS